MSITVRDCLLLPALREARVLGGHGGLNKIVSNVSVLEYADVAALETQLFLGNEMIITAFVCIKDDVQAQCNAISRLHETGEVCLVLYYVGIYVPQVDAKLIKRANDLDFPLIVMPLNKYNFRYSEVIMEVITAILNDQNQETDLVKNILDRMAQVKAELRTVDVVMRMLSDRLHCSLLLTDRNGSKLAFASWPMAAHWREEDLNRLIEMRHEYLNNHMNAFRVEGRTIYAQSVNFDTERQKGLSVLALMEEKEDRNQDIWQAAEVIRLFASIWSDAFTREGPDALLRAILCNQPIEMRRIAHNLRIDVEALCTMWVLIVRDESLSKAERKNLGERIASLLSNYLKNHHKTMLVDVLESYVIAFVDQPMHGIEQDLCDCFLEEIKAFGIPITLINCNNLATTEEVRSAYILIEDNLDMVRKIYPNHNIISHNELRFVHKCRQIIAKGEAETQQYLSTLHPVLKEENGLVIAGTLVIFMLDCGCSIQKTADLMHVHKNTIKYRLRRAKECFGFEVTKMPEMMGIYTSLALYRFMEPLA